MVPVQLRQLSLEVLEIGRKCYRVGIIDSHQVIIFRDNGTWQRFHHAIAEEGLNLGEFPGLVMIASSLCKERCHRVVLERGENIVPAGGVGGISAPRPRLESNKVEGVQDNLSLLRIVHMALHVPGWAITLKNLWNVGSRVAYEIFAPNVLRHAVLHISLDGQFGDRSAAGQSQDEEICPCSNVLVKILDTLVVDDFSDEEASRVGIKRESFHHTKDMLHEFLAVGFCWLSPVQSTIRQKRVDVHDHVDAGSIEDGSTVIMIGAGVHVVHMDGINLACTVNVWYE